MGIQKKIIDRFNSSQSRIEVHVTSVAASYEKVKMSFATGDPPDVCSAIWADELAGYAMRGTLTPLDDYLKQSHRSAEEYMPGIWDMFQYGGHTWALNVTTNSSFLLYNKKVFMESGVDPNKPVQTITDLDAVNSKLAKFDKNGNVFCFGYRPTGLEFWAYVFGGKWYDPKTKQVTANDPHNIEALKWMATYGKKYDLRKVDAFKAVFSSSVYHDDYAGLYGMFIGKVGILQTGEYALEHIQRYADPHFEYGYFSAPYPPGGRENTVTVGGSVFVIPNDCKHKQEAWEFLNYMTQPAQVKEFCFGIKNLPPLKALAQDPDFTSIPIYRFALGLVSGKNVFGPPQMPIWSYYQSEMGRAEEKAVLGQEDPKKVLDQVTVQIQRELVNSYLNAKY
jgi:multiple sugar transport system substrate-binding protein